MLIVHQCHSLVVSNDTFQHKSLLYHSHRTVCSIQQVKCSTHSQCSNSLVTMYQYMSTFHYTPCIHFLRVYVDRLSHLMKSLLAILVFHFLCCCLSTFHFQIAFNYLCPSNAVQLYNLFHFHFSALLFHTFVLFNSLS